MAGIQILEAKTSLEKAGLLNMPAFPVSEARCFSIRQNGQQVARALAIPMANGLELHLDAPGNEGNGVFKAFKTLLSLLASETGCNRFSTYCAAENLKAKMFIRALNFQPVGNVNGNQWYELWRWQIG